MRALRQACRCKALCCPAKFACCKLFSDPVLADLKTEDQQVLHFSLLRFVFDEKTFDRKKSTSYIKFPRVLNMAEFCPTPPGSSAEDMLYDVKGVLLHKGTSAHHGHYVAWVFDVQSVLSRHSVRVDAKHE